MNLSSGKQCFFFNRSNENRMKFQLNHLDMMIFSPSISNIDCYIYRLISLIYIVVCILAFSSNIHILTHDRHRFNQLAISLVVNSIVFIFISLPHVLAQAITCLPVESHRMCYFQGFVCYTCGICVMYTMTLLAFIQYIRLFYHSSFIHRVIEPRKNFLVPVACWLVSLFWSLPPLIDNKPGFIREGYGFNCGLNWTSVDIRSRLYLCLAFAFIYFLPFFCLLYTNLRILITIRQFIYQQNSLIMQSNRNMPIDKRKKLIDLFTVVESNRLKRLRLDRRFAQATMMTVLHYLLAWTPYALSGILQMSFTIKHIAYELPPMLLLVSALTAKLAVVGQAWIYYRTIRPLTR
jgi:hypothetical protein